MSEMLQIRVINLDRSYERLEFVSQGLNSSGLKWSRFPAIELPESGWSDLEFYVKGQSKRFYWDDLSRGELGCFLSHLGVMEQFLSSDKTLLLDLEDDVEFTAESAQYLLKILDVLNHPDFGYWDCINLTSVYEKRRRILMDFGDWKIFRAFCFPMLSSGMLWSRPGVERFVRRVARDGIFLPVDQQVRYYLSEDGVGLSLDKPVIGLRSVSTTIGDRRVGRPRYPVAKMKLRAHNYWRSFLARLLY